jgi:two-component system alkaline phosphatase synthesis response regulator PhoP
MTKELLYIVEDEQHIQQLIKYNLETIGYRATVFSDGETALVNCETEHPDMFILDIMLPGMDGLEVCKALRSNPKNKTTPVIILTAKGEEFDRVLGLELGADDYITKPFSVRELMARVKALFRRCHAPIATDEAIIKCGDIVIDCDRHEVTKNGIKIELPLKEYELLKLLALNPGIVMSRELLLEKVWGFDYFGETRTVDVHIRYLRQKIEDDDSNPTYIETVRGIGYKFADKGGK